MVNNITRICRSFLWPNVRLYLLITSSRRDELKKHIENAEEGNRAEIQVVIEGSLTVMDILKGKSVESRVEELFCLKGTWDTAGNTGILVSYNLAERKLAVHFDRGVPDDEICFSELIAGSINDTTFPNGTGKEPLIILQTFLDTLGNRLRESSLRIAPGEIAQNQLSDDVS